LRIPLTVALFGIALGTVISIDSGKVPSPCWVWLISPTFATSEPWHPGLGLHGHRHCGRIFPNRHVFSMVGIMSRMRLCFRAGLAWALLALSGLPLAGILSDTPFPANVAVRDIIARLGGTICHTDVDKPDAPPAEPRHDRVCMFCPLCAAGNHVVAIIAAPVAVLAPRTIFRSPTFSGAQPRAPPVFPPPAAPARGPPVLSR